MRGVRFDASIRARADATDEPVTDEHLAAAEAGQGCGTTAERAASDAARVGTRGLCADASARAGGADVGCRSPQPGADAEAVLSPPRAMPPPRVIGSPRSVCS